MIHNLEVRTVGTIQSVDPDESKRLVDLIVVPYDEWTPVEYQGRMIEESFAPGAFGGLSTAMGGKRERWLVNINHDPDRWIGKVEMVDPDDERGLRAQLKLRRTPEAREALMDAADGMYSGSIGFGVLPQHQKWDGRDRRRIVQAYFDHVALTATPAYQGAEILSVRTASTSSTPNLDRILAERAAQAYVIDV